MKNLVLTGGGTAGHVTPHLAILENLKNHFDNIYYIGAENGIEKSLIKNQNLPFYGISPTKLKRGFYLENLTLPFKLYNSVIESKKILKSLNPTVVFSKGGYVALPVTLACKSLNVPVVLHESDYTLGLANKLSAPYADKVLTTFEKTGYRLKNAQFVGAIIRPELFTVSKTEALKYYGFSANKPTLLVTGGSQGAKFLNDAVLSILPTLLKTFNVLHLVGKGNVTKTNFIGYQQREFTDMKYALSVADICVSRAGSNTAFELIKKNIPTLFIPLPKTNSRGDQIQNAKFFESVGVSKTLEQNNATPTAIEKEIINLFNNRAQILNNITKLNYPIANQTVINILKSY